MSETPANQPTPDPSKLTRLDGDTLADRINRLFEVFRNPKTGRPYSNAEVAAAITAAGTRVSERTLENARGNHHVPSASKIAGLADFFNVDAGYMFAGSRADTRARLQQEAAAEGGPSEAELRAIARFFQSPEWFLQVHGGTLGEQADAELELFLAMRDADVRAMALRYSRADPAARRAAARQLRLSRKKDRARDADGAGDGD